MTTLLSLIQRFFLSSLNQEQYRMLKEVKFQKVKLSVLVSIQFLVLKSLNVERMEAVTPICVV